MKLKPALRFSHQLLKEAVRPNDIVIDATAGNGNDTLFLAQLIGNKGHVYSFDVQAQAVANTKQLIAEHQLSDRVSIINDGHQNINQYVEQPINAAIFNLGYLPDGDHSIITKPDTTITAIQNIADKLAKNGLIILVIYYGHPGGQAEKDAVLNYAQSLPQKEYNVLQYNFINQINQPPMLVAIQKR